MERNLNNIYLIADNIISSLGFTTKENIDAIYARLSGVKLKNDGKISNSPILTASICEERLQELAASNNLLLFSKLEQLIILSITDILSQVDLNLSSDDCGLIISTTKGNIDLLENQTENLNPKIFLGNTATTISSYFNFGDRVTVLSNACISGVSALIVARRLIQSGIYRHVVVVGVDILSHFITSGFQSFKSISKNICRPYDSERDGLNIGEACGSILLTCDYRPDSIILRGGAISNDANHISGPSRTGDGLYYAIKGAMDEAEISSEHIGFVNLHGTATIFNDEMEAKAMHLANLQNIPANSLKPYFGHTLGASGVIETIVCMHQLKDHVIFGTLNYNHSGVTHPIKVSSKHCETSVIDTCIKTASGFGGCNAAIILSISESNKMFSPNKNQSYRNIAYCLIQNSRIHLGKDIAFISESEDFHTFIREAFKDLGDSNQKFYKMDNLSKLGYIAANHLLKGQTFEPCEIGIILSNKYSSLDTDIRYQKTIDNEDESSASPSIFVYTLPNIVSGEICIKHKIQGENTFFIQNEYNSHRLELYAQKAMEKANLRLCIYGWCEFLNNEYKAEFRLLERQ